MDHSVIAGNTATLVGGDAGGSVTLNHTTVAGNTADAESDGTGDGGGLYRAAGTVNVQSSVVVDNTDASPTGAPYHDCGGAVTSLGNTLERHASCGFTGPGDLQNAGPRLGPLQDNGAPR